MTCDSTESITTRPGATCIVRYMKAADATLVSLRVSAMTPNGALGTTRDGPEWS